MDFTKETEKASYRTGTELGFLCGAVIFCSMLFLILSKTRVIAYPYWYALALAAAVYVIATVIIRGRGR